MNDDDANTTIDEVNIGVEGPPNQNGPRPGMQKLKSIRRSSFLNSYFDLKEDDADDDSIASSLASDKNEIKHDEEQDGTVRNMTISVNPLEESDRSFIPIEGEDLPSSKPVFDREAMESFDFEDLSGEELPSRCDRVTIKHSNRTTSALSHDFHDAPSPPSSPRGDSETPHAPPVFGGNPLRRRGSLERRMLLKAGNTRHTVNEKMQNPLLDDDEELVLSANRRGSTSCTGMHKNDSCLSLASLASFTSASSVTSGEGVEVGNLTFVTDVEMIAIMYGDLDDDFDTDGGVNRVSYASLPPSAILGKGSFSTVRLAWRKTNTHANYRRSSMASSIESDLDMEQSHEKLVPDITPQLEAYKPLRNRRQSRRSIVRVISQPMDDSSQTSAKGDLVAVKMIQKSILKQMKTMTKDAKNPNRVTVRTAFDNIEREIAMMKRLQHPNLVRLFEVIDSVESDKLFMVLEYVSLGEILSHVEGTDIYKRTRYKKKVKGLTPGGFFDEKNAALYFVDIMHGLAYLHSHEICHRDLKPENILLGADGIAKISDFGVAHMFDNEKDDAIRASIQLSITSTGSLTDLLDDSDRDQHAGYMYLSRRDSDQALNMPSQHSTGILTKTEGTWCFWSPEMCNKNTTEFSGFAADLWAAGVCLFIFTTGRLPFFSMAPLDLFEQIAKADVPYHLHPDMTDSLKGILRKMLTKDPAQRAGVGFCLQHEFCSSARIQRVNELGKEFNSSDQGIVLTNDEVKTAFSITMHSPKKNHVAEINCAPIAEAASDTEEITSTTHDSVPVITNHDEKTNTTSSSSAQIQKQKSRRTLKRVSDNKIAGATRSKNKCVIQ